VDDSKRQSANHRCPLDEHALIERLKEWELEAHNHVVFASTMNEEVYHDGLEKAYRRVIDLIKSGRVRQQHRELTRK
jgi:hypothetical protein